MPLLLSSEAGFGSSNRASVANLRGDDAFIGRRFDLDAPLNSREGVVRLWPFDGARSVPITWSGGEEPDPLTGYAGDRNNMGPVLFADAPSGSSLTLRGPGGPVPLLAPAELAGEVNPVTGAPRARATPRRASRTFEWTGGPTAVFAARPLQAGGRYVLTVVNGGRSYRSSFIAAGGGSKRSLVWIVSMRMRGRSLTVRLMVSEPGRLRAVLRRSGARVGARTSRVTRRRVIGVRFTIGSPARSRYALEVTFRSISGERSSVKRTVGRPARTGRRSDAAVSRTHNAAPGSTGKARRRVAGPHGSHAA
jgi:hypothetical protein